MGACRWCTSDDSVVNLLKSYASSTLPANEFASANNDLCYCIECVDEYHKAKDELPSFHEILCKLEITRLITHFEKSMQEEDDSDLFIVDKDGETQLCHYTDSNFEENLRVPLLEMLKYPYLLLHERLSELCVEALCKMEEINCSYQVAGKHPGIYLLMVHPNEVIRQWAILKARSLGKVDRDDYYNIQEVLTCLFRVIELDHFENSDTYNLAIVEKGNLILLPRHLYDTTSYKNYWLGICMLLMVLEEQAMDLLLFGPDKQIDFMPCIMKAMKKPTEDESINPFWPALHCFMVILDKLGSKVWGQVIDPIQAFQTIVNNASYQKARETVRQSCIRTKSEPMSDYGDEFVTCSQLAHDYHIEKPHKDTICPDYCLYLYKDMQTLTDLLHSDIGQDMQLHNSTFLWFIPFIHSLMDLKDLGIAYSIVVIHHLCLEIQNVLSGTVETCDKVSEFFIWILVTVVECSLKKNCLHFLWISSEMWVWIVVKCVMLPSTVFMPGIERRVVRNSLRSTVTSPSWEPEPIQFACMKLIRNILKEGYQVVQSPTCKQFLDELNLLRRSHKHWELSSPQALELQNTLKEIIWSIMSKSLNPSSLVKSPPVCVTSPTFLMNHKRQEDGCPMNMDNEHLPCLSVLANRHMDAQKNVVSHQWPGFQNKQDPFYKSFGLSFQDLETKDFSTKEKPSSSRSLTEKNGNSSSALERKVGLNDLTSKIRSLKPDSTLQLKLLPESSRRGNTNLEPGTEKLQLVRDRTKSQEGQRSEIIVARGSTSDTLPCKSEASSGKASVVCAKGTSLPIDSSQESIIRHQKCIKRKAKGAVQTLSARESNKLSAGADDSPNQVIISDASSDEDENKMKAGRESRKGQVDVCLEKKFSAPEQEPLTTPDLIHHTAAREGHIGKGNAVVCSNFTGICAGNGSCSRCTDPVLPSTSASASPSGSAPAVKESTIQPGKSSVEYGQVKIARESPKGSIKPSMHSKKPLLAKLARSTPALLPPNEIQHMPAPTLVTEKHGLSEKVQRAAELAQCTQDSLAELHSYREIVGEVDVPQERTSQLVNAQQLTTRNKNNFACQKRQLYRQTNPKERENCQCTHGETQEAQPAKKPKAAELRPVQSASMVGVEKQKESSAGASKTNHLTFPDPSSSPCDEDVALKKREPQLNENKDGDGFFLTQLDPVDMELCSQIEDGSYLSNMEVNISASPLQGSNDDLQFKTPTLSSILQPRISNNTPQLLNVQNNHIVMALPTPRAGSWNKVHQPFAQANIVNAQQRDHGIFTREVLKWNYDMFANFKLFGPPSHLLQSIVAPVTAKFEDYNDYFNTFFPLMMLNAFEMMAQEWLENQKSKEQRPFELNLLNFNADTNEADFTINISRSNLEKQLHPKECDLVFLILSEKQNFYSKEGKAESCPLRHVGYVTRFHTEMKEQDACLLSVKTQGNLSGVDKNVRCVVVSSLVTTEQMFKALLLLNRSPLAKAIISPQNSDFCLTGSTVDLETSSSYMKELNEDQRTAIETAYTFVMKLPSLPKVCLIHGPPGTGKSKTILGLLYRILSKRSGKENPVESKIKRNRVLVCAPSNAALDHLMKIMIVEFKEKCQDKEKPLGNCGDINLVRLGEEKWISKDVQKFSLDAQANRRMKTTVRAGNSQACRREQEAHCSTEGGLWAIAKRHENEHHPGVSHHLLHTEHQWEQPAGCSIPAAGL
ncbi:putative helicase senataxin isoform X2 [Podarcis muralis]